MEKERVIRHRATQQALIGAKAFSTGRQRAGGLSTWVLGL